ncbi:hypothetical protein [Eikenella corrodens]|nr:hypothetical protein [Eikenella corrodens]
MDEQKSGQGGELQAVYAYKRANQCGVAFLILIRYIFQVASSCGRLPEKR